MTDFQAKKRCDRCGAGPAAGRLYRIPWTGDLLCKDCIDRDGSIQQLFAELDSMSYDRHLRDLGVRTALPGGNDMRLSIIEPDEK